MSLVNYVKITDIDPGVRKLVINLNRIPGVYTQTTCEGHVWREVPAWPTKDGWVHFQKSRKQHDRLVVSIDDYCRDNAIFTLTDRTWKGQNEIDEYTINGLFEPHQGDDGLKPFDEMTRREQNAYWKQADARMIEILKGWNELNQVVIRYIRENIGISTSKLPYRDKNDKTDFRCFCGMCR